MIDIIDPDHDDYTSCHVCSNMVNVKTLQIGSQEYYVRVHLCHMCRTALVSQLIEVR